MARFLHVADLHLSAREYDYCAGVLQEIAGVAATLNVDAILVAGHLANTEVASFADLLARTCEWLWVPGSRETTAGCSNVRLLTDLPFQLEQLAGVEILALPHQPSYADFRDWAVPEKQSAQRLALAHAGVVSLPTLTRDSAGGAIDPELFERFESDSAALGSAHTTCAPTRHGGTLVADPGSARVTGGEQGIRGTFLLDIGETVEARWVALPSAGQRRELILPVAVDGSFPAVDTSVWGPADAVVVYLSGVLWQTEPARVEQRAREQLGGRARDVRIDSNRLVAATDRKLAALARRLETTSTDQHLLRARAQGLALLVSAGCPCV